MSVEKVLKATNIPLKREINGDEAKRLLRYLAAELPADINYDFSGATYLTRSPFLSSIIHESSGSTNIKGIIIRSKPLAYDSFEFTSSRKNSSKIAAIQFKIVPDRELKEYEPEVRRLWKNVRGAVKQYFESK